MTLDPSYFDRMYAADADPWGFEHRWYERRKYALTVAALPRARYAAGFEPGCSIGVLTEELASRCDRLLATDPAAAAVRAAKDRLAGHPHVHIGQANVPAGWPAGSFDLIVLSELGYYLDHADLDALLDRAIGALAGDLVAVHWRHPVAEYPLGGDEVHAALARRPELARTVRHVEADFLLEVFARAPVRSVAQVEGLC